MSECTQSLNGKDLEKGADDEAEVFKLHAYLTSSNDQSQTARLSHKHVGVIWDNLQVAEFGGAVHKVSPLNPVPPHLGCKLGLICDR